MALAVFYTVGIVGMVAGYAPLLAPLTPLILLITAVAIFINHKDWRNGWVFIVTYAGGLLVEVLGVNTGFPFGEYTYGEVLGLKVIDTPLIIGINWLLLLYATNSLARHFSRLVVNRALMAAGLMVVLDYLIEPVAMAYDFWTWNEPQPPIENYLGWFVTAFILSIPWQITHMKLNRKIAATVYAAQLLFFGVLNLALWF